MTTYEIPETLAARLPEEAVRRFRTYAPVGMPLPLWERSRLDLLTLVADTEPPNDADARKVLGAICGFYTWAADRYGENTVAELCTRVRINAYDGSRVESHRPGRA